MRWDAKITDTAKISVEVRWILIDRVDAILSELRLLRQRAIGYASPESVSALAARISLPPASKDESEALGEGDPSGSCSEGFQLLPQVVISDDKEGILDALLGSQHVGFTEHLEGVETFCGLEETWFQRLDYGVEDLETLDPLRCWESVCEEAECNSYPRHNAEKDDLPCPDFGEGNNHPLHNTERDDVPCPDFGAGNNYPLRNTARQIDYSNGHALLTPWCDSLPNRLQAYLDDLDAAREITLSSFDLSPFDDGPLKEASPYGYVDTDTSTEPDSFCSVQFAARELLQYLHATCPPAYPVDTDQLLELQAYMQQVVRFRTYLARSLLDVRNALNRREERYRMREANGSITAIMKSHGEGSPLAKTTSVDEEWAEEDAWASPVTMQAECVAFQKAGFDADKVKW